MVMANVNGALIAELEEAVHSHSAERRVETLRRVTDLFLGESDRLNDEQIGLFDDVLASLSSALRPRRWPSLVRAWRRSTTHRLMSYAVWREMMRLSSRRLF
jgi:hypothetical protein